ncbi:hypothetical protein DICSQDRAFT_137602 [Dichomitus squalens LYAD-421 SS1]|uniref:Uncharacterized protein n=1 Tax=Dichomitus squalens (strain LYAD-421) TaxID=732165 RepID=R7SVR1_DICSQ|nr:uncharacterized protein DICSQDRAFT_137602 [Dichomitus squalens LYAD-421 SS1]EJF60274.1 hypothetical protein DICSQDRAFT_137602 [Dichomitus squalens LYAD-421 SS1]
MIRMYCKAYTPSLPVQEQHTSSISTTSSIQGSTTSKTSLHATSTFPSTLCLINLCISERPHGTLILHPRRTSSRVPTTITKCGALSGAQSQPVISLKRRDRTQDTLSSQNLAVRVWTRRAPLMQEHVPNSLALSELSTHAVVLVLVMISSSPSAVEPAACGAATSILRARKMTAASLPRKRKNKGRGGLCVGCRIGAEPGEGGVADAL